ncbi:hypothetical protein GCM10022288_21890 [Gryllotalpicola kribbensis]|jgi:hypothetical protein|uniref:FHA domain-containing protein n=1 Tax=Gryllotalpicola kribbensis TaxID=993084 RepID=A0ABP8AVC6_9MICO
MAPPAIEAVVDGEIRVGDHGPSNRIGIGEPAQMLLQPGIGSSCHARVQTDTRHHQERVGRDGTVRVLQSGMPDVDLVYTAAERGLHRGRQVVHRQAERPHEKIAGPCGRNRERDPAARQLLGNRANRAITPDDENKRGTSRLSVGHRLPSLVARGGLEP